MECLDGINAARPGFGALVLATTNADPRSLDAAAVRPGGRIGTQIHLGLPNLAERTELYARMAAPWTGDPAPDFARAARLSPRLTPAEIRGNVESAVGIALLRDGPRGRLRDEDVQESIRLGSRIEPDDDEVPQELPRVAVHEAGHCMVALRLGLPVRSVELSPGRRGGRTETGEEGRLLSAGELWASVVVGLAGIVAEEVLLGGATAGGHSDVHRTTDLLIGRIESGLDDGFVPVSRRAFGPSWTPLALDDRIVPRVVAELAVARSEARRIVEEEREVIEPLAATLLDAPVLSGSELDRAIEAARQPTTA